MKLVLMFVIGLFANQKESYDIILQSEAVECKPFELVVNRKRERVGE